MAKNTKPINAAIFLLNISILKNIEKLQRRSIEVRNNNRLTTINSIVKVQSELKIQEYEDSAGGSFGGSTRGSSRGSAGGSFGGSAGGSSGGSAGGSFGDRLEVHLEVRLEVHLKVHLKVRLRALRNRKHSYDRSRKHFNQNAYDRNFT